MIVLKLKFKGVDSFNHPVFVNVKNKNDFFGSVDTLFNREATAGEVIAALDWRELQWFGKSFGCEPMGARLNDNVQIVFDVICEKVL